MCMGLGRGLTLPVAVVAVVSTLRGTSPKGFSMHNHVRGFLLTVLFLSTGLVAAEGLPKKVERLEFPDGGVVTLAHPEGWKFRRTPPSPTMPPSIKLTADSGGPVSLQLTFMPAGGTPWDTQEKIDQALKQTADAQYAGGSVEKKTTVEHLTCNKGMGSYAFFTDADLVGKEVRPGQFRIVATGIVVYGEQRGIFTLLADSIDQSGFKEALKVVTEGIGKE